ncbi:MAG TPA: sigma-70 family RNA polymerase sigma factor [Planctomycetota bacterium]
MNEPAPQARRGEELLAHGRFLRALARGLVGAERADDLLQDTYVAAIAHPPRHDSAPRAWLARILRNRARTRGQREGERPRHEARAAREHAADEERDAPALLAELELARALLAALEGLREPYRGTLYLRYYRGLAPAEIAARAGLPPKTVKTRLARGLALLRVELDRRPGGREAWVALLLPLARGPAPLAPGPPPALALPVPLALAGLVLLGAGGAWLALRARDATLPAAPAPHASAPELAPSTPLRAPAPRAAREVARPSPPAAPAPAPVLRLAGSVLDEAGHPLGDARVQAVVLASGPSFARGAGLEEDEEPGPLAEAHTTSAPDGSFALALEPGGLVRIVVARAGRAPVARRLFGVSGQTLALAPLVLWPAEVLEGEVLDPAGLPVPGAELLLVREDEGLVGGRGVRGFELAGTSDARGRFHLTDLAPGAWQLEVRAAGFAPLARAGHAPWREAEHGPLVLTLAPGGRLAGEVLGLAPGEHARVQLLVRPLAPAPEEHGPRVRLVALDERGAFELAGLALDEEHELLLLEVAGGAARPRSEPVRARAGAEPVTLVARPGEPAPPLRAGQEAPAAEAGTLTLVVRTLDGRPLAAALVAHRAAGAREGFEASTVRATDAEGRLEWRGLAPGAHAFRVIGGAFGAEEPGAPWTHVELEPGGTAALELAGPEPCALRGEVRSGGVALAGASVWLRPAQGGTRGPAPALRARTDGRGHFELRGLAPGRYALEVLHPERAQAERRTLELDGTQAELVLELSEARLAGRVVDELGAPVAGARLALLVERGRGGARGQAGTDAEGRFELVGVEPARALRLEVTAPGRATLQREVEATGAPLELVLVPEVPLALELTGTPRPFLELVAEGPEGQRLGFYLGHGSTLDLPGLGPGTWRLTLRAGRGARGEEPPWHAAVELVAGVPVTLPVELP